MVFGLVGVFGLGVFCDALVLGLVGVGLCCLLLVFGLVIWVSVWGGCMFCWLWLLMQFLVLIWLFSGLLVFRFGWYVGGCVGCGFWLGCVWVGCFVMVFGWGGGVGDLAAFGFVWVLVWCG